MKHLFLVTLTSQTDLSPVGFSQVLASNLGLSIEHMRQEGELSRNLGEEDGIESVDVIPFNKNENKDLYTELQRADAINIDDDFIRYFNYTSEDGIDEDDEPKGDLIALEAGRYEFTFDELKSATYDPEAKEWGLTRKNEVLCIELYDLIEK